VLVEELREVVSAPASLKVPNCIVPTVAPADGHRERAGTRVARHVILEARKFSFEPRDSVANVHQAASFWSVA
jgi:hypothetical protein